MGSCATPSDIRRLRAARLNFEAPSFSLGIDTEAFTGNLSFGEFQENKGQEGRNSLRTRPPNDEFLENGPECSEKGSKGCKSVEEVVNDSEDDFQIFTSPQQGRFKRLKRGPSSAGKEPLKDTRDLSSGADISRLSKDRSEFCTQVHDGKFDLSRKTDISVHRKSKDLSIFSTQLYKEPLPFVKHSKNQGPEDLTGAGLKGTEFLNSEQTEARTGSGDRVLSSKCDHRSGRKLSEKERSPGSGEAAHRFRDLLSTEVSKFGFQRERDSTQGPLHFNKESSSQNERSNPSVNTQPSSTGNVDVDEDDIEEFSDDGLFGSGSGTQRARRRSLRPQISGSIPILLSSSPETSQKPVLRIPRADIAPKAVLRSQPTELTTSDVPNSEEDPFLIDDFVSGSGWRRTKPAQTPQHLNNSASKSQKSNSVPNPFKASKRDLFRDTNLKSFYTETPVRRDIVGPSQALLTPEGNETEKDRMQAFLRRRFPHFKPVDALLVDGGLDNEPVYIDYRRQFADGKGAARRQSGNNMGTDTRWSPVRSINGAFSASPPSIPAQRRNLGKKMVIPEKSNPGRASTSSGRNSRAKKRGPGGSGEGKWRTVHGSRVYIVGNQKLSGQRAYCAYKKRSGNSSSKKSKKRPSTKSK